MAEYEKKVRKIKSRFTANAIMKQSGIGYRF